MKLLSRSAITIVFLMVVAAFMRPTPLALATPVDVDAPQIESDDPLTIVENFLLARTMGDFSSAAGWCAPLLELQDDDQWFVDRAATSNWLRQLADQFFVATVNQPVASGNVVTWTERLTRRDTTRPDLGAPRMSVEVHAVIRDGKIAYLSGPYPPIPFHNHLLASTELASFAGPSGKVVVPPAAMFALSSLGLATMGLLASRICARLGGAPRRRDDPIR